MSQAVSQSSVSNLTEEEATRYDRQMRLWGIEAQQRCRFCLRSWTKSYRAVMQNEECDNSGCETRRRRH